MAEEKPPGFQWRGRLDHVVALLDGAWVEIRHRYQSLSPEKKLAIQSTTFIAAAGGVVAMGRRSMPKKVFFSFHFKPDNWRAGQVRNAGVVEGNQPVSDNEWESITGRGDQAIQNWINGQMSGRSAAVVLIGSGTAGRKWINYEIVKAWNDHKGVVGIHVHKLKNSRGEQAAKGRNPFELVSLGGTRKLSSVVKAYDPPQATSTAVYEHIKNNLEGWVTEAIGIRRAYG